MAFFEDWTDIGPLVACATVALVTVYFLSKRDPPDYPPGPTAFPIIGNLVQVGRAKNFYYFLKEQRKKYGNVFRLHLGQVPIVFVFGYHNISRIMIDTPDNSMDRPDWLFVPRVVLKKKGIVWTSGKPWARMHKFLVKAQLDRNIQVKIQNEFNKEIDDVCKYFSASVAVDPTKYFQMMVINIVSVLVFGKRFDHDDANFKALRCGIDYFFAHGQSSGRPETFLPMVSIFTKSKINRLITENKKLYDLVRENLEEHRLDYDPSRTRDILDMYIGLPDSDEENEAFEGLNLLQSLIDLFNAGCATYTPTMFTAVFYLIKYPDVQKRCREEILKNTQHGEPVVLNDREKLPYLENTIKEIMRLAKPVVTSVYRTNKQSLTVEGYTIPPKSVILFDLMDPQLDPDLWDHPDQFNPDRWTDGKQKGFMPFGAGPRYCVAALTADITLFLLLSNLMKKYKLTAENEDSLTFEKTYDGVALTPKPYKLLLKPIDLM